MVWGGGGEKKITFARKPVRGHAVTYEASKILLNTWAARSKIVFEVPRQNLEEAHGY